MSRHQLADGLRYDSSSRTGIPSKSRFNGAPLSPLAGHTEGKLSVEATTAEMPSLEEKIEKRKEASRELSLIRLEKQGEAMMAMIFQVGQETIAALKRENHRLEELDYEMRQWRQEKRAWEQEEERAEWKEQGYMMVRINYEKMIVQTKLETYARAKLEWDVLRRRLEDDVRSGLDKRETLYRELEDARRECYQERFVVSMLTATIATMERSPSKKYFADQVMALINDDRTFNETLNAAKAQELAMDGTLALKFYQKHVKTIEERGTWEWLRSRMLKRFANQGTEKF
ncbi:hypothetical protein BYT27DRAFT_7209355 [Phlegmacium glaucopus]|nr:hypothetical protein BYT27DRAFT_7209355 [Phlegmacium glaucopus]